MDNKSSSPTPDEPLVPQGNFLPRIVLPEIKGFGVGIGLIVLAIAFHVAMRYLSPWHGTDDFGIAAQRGATLRAVEGFLFLVFPSLTGLIMLWMAFVRDRGDRFLWSGLMIFTTSSVSALLNAVIPPFSAPLPVPLLPADKLADDALVTGTITCLTLYVAFTRRGAAYAFATIAVLVMIPTYALPIYMQTVSWYGAVTSLLVACGLWSIAVEIARRVGFDVYGDDAAAA